MTMKIFRSSFIVGLCVLLISAGLFLAVLYGYYENRVYDELSAQAQSIASASSAQSSFFIVVVLLCIIYARLL